MVKLLAGILPPLPGRRVAAAGAVLLALAVVCQNGLAAAVQFSSRVSLVEVYATVTDSSGRLVKGLRAEDFTVEEDGVPQAIQAFANGEFPLTVAVGIDRSFSMSDQALMAAATATRGFAARLERADQLMILGIGSQTEVLSPLSSDRERARQSLERLERWGTTPLFDAVIQAIDAVQPAPGRRALILLSDGDDRYSQATAADVVGYARQHDVLVYPVSMGRTRVPVWAEVAAVSGGRSFAVRDPKQLPATLSTIADELRQQYLLGYVPAGDGSAGWKSIRVRVNRPQVQVRARDGYRASGR